MYDGDDDLDDAGTTGAIVLPSLHAGAKLNITSTMIQLYNRKGAFVVHTTDDINMHLLNFLGNYKEHKIPRETQDGINLWLFSLIF